MTYIESRYGLFDQLRRAVLELGRQHEEQAEEVGEVVEGERLRALGRRDL